jgi:hypothetical protein
MLLTKPPSGVESASFFADFDMQVPARSTFEMLSSPCSTGREVVIVDVKTAIGRMIASDSALSLKAMWAPISRVELPECHVVNIAIRELHMSLLNQFITYWWWIILSEDRRNNP